MPTGHKLTPTQLKTMARLYRHGFTMPQIAKRMKVSYDTVRHRLGKDGLQAVSAVPDFDQRHRKVNAYKCKGCTARRGVVTKVTLKPCVICAAEELRLRRGVGL